MLLQSVFLLLLIEHSCQFKIISKLYKNRTLLKSAGGSEKTGNAGNTVELELFGASRCGGTSVFFRYQLLPAYKLFGTRLRINYHPFGNPKFTKCTSRNGKYECTCQHGKEECHMNALQACVMDKLPSAADHLELINCIQRGFKLNETAVECIDKGEMSSRLSSKQMLQCALGNTGLSLMARHGSIMQQKAPKLLEVPWLLINGKHDEAAERNLISALCARYLTPRPSECDTYKPRFIILG